MEIAGTTGTQASAARADMTDVLKAFEIPNLRFLQMHKNGAYTRKIDYTVFRVL